MNGVIIAIALIIFFIFVIPSLTERIRKRKRLKEIRNLSEEIHSNLKDFFVLQKAENIYKDFLNPESELCEILYNEHASTLIDFTKQSSHNAEIFALIHAKPYIFFTRLINNSSETQRKKLQSLENAINKKNVYIQSIWPPFQNDFVKVLMREDYLTIETEESNSMDCPACLGKGGHFVNSSEDDAEYVLCKDCKGIGKITDHRTREQKLDDWENGLDNIIPCSICQGSGLVNDGNVKRTCMHCNGYGAVLDNITKDEQKELSNFLDNDEEYDYNINDLVRKVEYLKNDIELMRLSLTLEIQKSIKENNISDTLIKKIENKCNSMSSILENAQDMLSWISLIVFACLILYSCPDNKKETKITLKDVNETIDSIDDRVRDIEHTVDKINEKLIKR